MDQGKAQVFPYSLRSVAMANGVMCNNRYFFQVIPPENALTIENLYTHVVINFDVSVATGNRTLKSIGITDGIPLTITANATYQRRITLNTAADADGALEMRLDLSTLLKKTTPACYVEVVLNDALVSTPTIGTFTLWKTDALYTTTGIR